MHYSQFLKKLKTVENYKELCKSFRINACNRYEYFLQQKKLAFECESIYLDTSNLKKQELEDEWMQIGEEKILEICNNIDIKYAGAKFAFNSEYEPYYEAHIDELWNILSEVPENEKFMLAMIDFIRFNYNDHIQKLIVEPLSKWLEQQGFGDFVAQKVFVAMWFDDSMKEARDAIKEAISDCGYTANIIDEKEHNHDIVPEILHEIDNSKFMVSDLTGNRGGVYYEAGYAKGIGKEVVFTAKAGEKTHFDVAQVNTIFWKNENELKDRLIKRIKSTIK